MDRKVGGGKKIMRITAPTPPHTRSSTAPALGSPLPPLATAPPHLPWVVPLPPPLPPPPPATAPPHLPRVVELWPLAAPPTSTHGSRGGRTGRQAVVVAAAAAAHVCCDCDCVAGVVGVDGGERWWAGDEPYADNGLEMNHMLTQTPMG